MYYQIISNVYFQFFSGSALLQTWRWDKEIWSHLKSFLFPRDKILETNYYPNTTEILFSFDQFSSQKESVYCKVKKMSFLCARQDQWDSYCSWKFCCFSLKESFQSKYYITYIFKRFFFGVPLCQFHQHFTLAFLSIFWCQKLMKPISN